MFSPFPVLESLFPAHETAVPVDGLGAQELVPAWPRTQEARSPRIYRSQKEAIHPPLETLIAEFEENAAAAKASTETQTEEEARIAQEMMLQERRARAEEEGYRSGFAEGEERGFREGQARGFEQGQREALAAESARFQVEIDAFLTALEGKAADLNVAIEAWFNQSEVAMADLAIEVVKRLLSSELATSRTSTLAIAKEALAEVTHARHARIRINPFDIPLFEAHRPQLLAASCSLQDVDLVEDPDIQGGCFIETEGGVVDSTLQRRLQTLEESWQQAA